MNGRLTWILALTLAATTAHAQPARRLPRGEITGLEMGIDGTLEARPGAEIRWFVTLYEVMRHRDLRPAPDATLTVSSSHARGTTLAETTTDRDGHATLVIPVSEELEHAPTLRVTAVSPRGVRRVFAVRLRLQPPRRVELFVDRDHAPPGGAVAAFGRVVDARGRPVEGVEVRVRGQRGAIATATSRATTGAGGAFLTTLALPDTTGTATVSADAEDATGDRARVQLVEAEALPMWVDVAQASPARPEEETSFTITVRDPRGRPVAGARVEVGEEEPLRSGEDGTATWRWRAPARDGARSIRVTHPRLGERSISVPIDVEAAPFLVGWSVDGGALVPELDGRVFLRVVRPDGTPLGDAALTVEAPRLGGERAQRTDADGVATIEGAVGRPPSGDATCGGVSATEIFVTHDGHRARVCVPVEVDATLALDAPAVHAGGPLEVAIARRPSVRSRAVEVTALVRQGDAWTPIARAFAAPSEARVTLALPDGSPGPVWLRARPRLDEGRPALGGSRMLWRGSRPPTSLTADGDGARVEAPEGTRLAFAIEGDAAALANALRGRFAAGLDEGSDVRLAASLAERTPRDESASAVLREGVVAIAPLPAEPVTEGLLRDPWRTRARFMRGRVGRILRAVESYVAARLPDHLEECAVEEGGRWRFNQGILEAAMSQAGLHDEEITSIDGERVDLDGLRAMVPELTFDHVAARLTRERLFEVSRQLRELVRARGLDRPWARRGDPARILAAMTETGDLQPDALHDAWGRPFVLRRARGESFLNALPGFDVVSAGPDGRVGTGDDLDDPFATILPAGGAYAEAVGEDILLARLRRVALDRVALEALLDREPTPDAVEAAPALGATLESLPRPTPTTAERRLPRIDGPIGGRVGDDGGVRWGEARPPEHRAYEAIAIAFAPDGGLGAAHDRFEAGAPWAAHVELPRSMRPSERLRVPIALVRLGEGPPPSLDASATGPLEVTVDGAAVVLAPTGPGLATVRVAVRAEGRELAAFERRVRVLPPGSLRARHAGTRVDGEQRFDVQVPEGARTLRARLVIGAPRALDRDPTLSAAREAHPACFAWAEAMRGDAPDEALTVAMGAVAAPSSLALACARVAEAAAWRDDEEGRAAPTESALPLPEALEDRAATLAALAAIVPRDPTPGAPLTGQLAELRRDGWRTLATASDRPAAMARMAAALLLVDPEDAPGRALLAEARRRLRRDAHGRRWVPGADDRAGDGWVGTVALAIAARQAGEDALADELGASVVSRLHLAPRLGDEGVFWAAAAGVYGALGVDGPQTVDVTIDGEARTVPIEGGIAVVPIGGGEVTVRTAGPVWARTELRAIRPWEAGSSDGPLAASIEGTAGEVGERAGFELVVENAGDDPVGLPVVEVALPGAAALDEETRAAMEGHGAQSVSAPDGAGVVRIRLAPLAAHATHRLPLPVRWTASGQTVGLALSAYDASTPWRARRSSARTIEVAEEPDR